MIYENLKHKMKSWRGYYHSDEDWLMPSPLQVSIIPLNLARYSCVEKNIGQNLNKKKINKN